MVILVGKVTSQRASVVVRSHASQLVDLGSVPLWSHTEDIKKVFTASLLEAQNQQAT